MVAPTIQCRSQMRHMVAASSFIFAKELNLIQFPYPILNVELCAT